MLRAVRMSRCLFCFHRHRHFQHGYVNIEVIVVIVLSARVSRTSPILFISVTFDIVNVIVNIDIITIAINITDPVFVVLDVTNVARVAIYAHVIDVKYASPLSTLLTDLVGFASHSGSLSTLLMSFWRSRAIETVITIIIINICVIDIVIGVVVSDRSQPC